MGVQVTEGLNNAQSPSPTSALSDWHEVCARRSRTICPALYRIPKRSQNTPRKSQSVVLHVRGIATDRYCPGPECCGGRRSVAAFARSHVMGEHVLYGHERCSW